ncbi:hypothetical protein KAT51_08585, partial [bacterium]|nr:hypothetical protein [bacterium]
IPKILLAGTPSVGGNLNEYRLYNIERSLKSLPFLQIELSECLRIGHLPYESHFLKDFPVSLSGLSEHKAIILIDIPCWVFTKKDQDNLLAYVKQGGNLIFAGDHARGYKGTKLAELFPLDFDYTKEVKGYTGRIMKDKSSWLKPAIFDKNNPIIRGLPTDIPSIVVHKSKVKEGNLILTAGDYPLLAEKDYGKGKVISFPISLTDMVVPASGRPDRYVKYNFRDDKLMNWSFYDELWRNIILYSLNKMPSVDFSRITPPDELITYPASIKLPVEVTNFSNTPQKGSLFFTLYKNKKEIRKEDIKYSLSPGEKKETVFKIESGYPRGKYSYRIDIKNEKGNVLSWLDDSFSTIPKTFLQVELPIIPVFGKNSSVDLTIAPFNLNKENKYYIKTSLFDFKGRKVLQLSPVEVIFPEAFHQKSKEIKQNLPIGNLMKGDYQIAIELSENEKGIDMVKKSITLVPSLAEEDIYPNIIFTPGTADKGKTVENIKLAKDIGFNGIQQYSWAHYRKAARQTHLCRMSLYAMEQAQKLGMSFCPYSSYSQKSWNRWEPLGNACFNTPEDIRFKGADLEDINDYLFVYGKSPRQIACYTAD